MKKFLIVFTILGSIITTSSFAQDKIPAMVSKSFQDSYKDAKEVKWTEVSNLYKAYFIIDGQAISAFFDENGKLVASSRNISVLQLPISLQIVLKNKYSGYQVNDLFEIDNEIGNTYYVTIESNGQKL